MDLKDRSIPLRRPVSPWQDLYRVGAAAALLAVFVFRRNLGTEWLLLRSMGVFQIGPVTAPTAAGEWFALFNEHPFLGLTLFNLFDLVNYTLVGLIFLGLYAAFRRSQPGAALLAAASGLAGVTLYFASNRAFAMLALGEQYAAAAEEAARAAALAAGQALLAVDNPGAPHPGSGAYLSLLLVTAAGLVFALAMRRSPRFGRAAAWTGLLAEACILGYLAVLGFSLGLAAAFASLSALFRIAWYLLIARTLLRLAAGDEPAENEMEAALGV